MNYKSYTRVSKRIEIRHLQQRIFTELLYLSDTGRGSLQVQREFVSPLKVTHLSPYGILYFPWLRHQIKATTGFWCLFRKPQAMWGERNCLSFVTAVGGIEPSSPRLTVRRSTARPPLMYYLYIQLKHNSDS